MIRDYALKIFWKETSETVVTRVEEVYCQSLYGRMSKILGFTLYKKSQK